MEIGRNEMQCGMITVVSEDEQIANNMTEKIFATLNERLRQMSNREEISISRRSI